MARAASPPHADLPFPPDLVAAVRDEAGRDADRVAVFLDGLGLGGTPEKPVYLPAPFLLYLGGALRLWSWERQGLLFGSSQKRISTHRHR